MPLGNGDLLGPYAIVDRIGAGGMGEVYRARDTRLDRVVAIKVLPEHLSKDARARRRLEREARAVSSLSHPHICALYDIGQQEGLYYLVLEYLDGRTLAARLAEGPLPIEEALERADEIADALHQAHRQGVVHRDLKPGNVMLTKSGVKLLDFGLSRSVEDGATASELTAAPTASSPLTMEGTLLGTLQYMSPEQLERKPADVRSDVFAFGALLYEMVTGRRAFEGKTQASVIAAIMKERPRSISELIPLSPPALDRLVGACLAKDPEDRRQSMRDVQLDLRWVGGTDTADEASRLEGRSRASPGPWIVAAIATLAALVLAVALVGGTAAPKPEPRIIRALIPPPEGTVFEFGTANPGPVAVSPDGRRIAFSARDEDGTVRLWIRDLGSLDARSVPGTKEAGYPFWSPDGRSLGFFAQEKLKRVDLGVGRPRDLCAAPIGKGGTWNRAGVILFAPGFNTAIHRVPEEGGKSIAVTEMEEGWNSHRFPLFLTDGRHFLYQSVPDSPERRPAAMIGVLQGTEQRRIAETDGNAQLSAGHLLYLIDDTLVAQRFDETDMELKGDPFQIAVGVARYPGAFLGLFSSSPDGVLVYQPAAGDRTVELVWTDRAGQVLESFGKLTAPPDSMDLSRDGKRLAVNVADAAGRGLEAWLVDTESGQRSRFTFGINTFSPVWSPDGETLLFMGTKQGSFGLYTKSVRGSDVVTFVEQPKGAGMSWSSDGRFIALMGPSPDTGADIWILPTAGDREAYPFVKTTSLEVNPRFSPDGRWVAYASNETGSFEVYVASFEDPSRKWQVSTDGGQSPKWRADGKEIFFATADNRIVAIPIDLKGVVPSLGAAEVLFELTVLSDSIWQLFEVSPDGQRFLVFRPASGARPDRSSLVLVSDWTAGTDPRAEP